MLNDIMHYDTIWKQALTLTFIYSLYGNSLFTIGKVHKVSWTKKTVFSKNPKIVETIILNTSISINKTLTVQTYTFSYK